MIVIMTIVITTKIIIDDYMMMTLTINIVTAICAKLNKML